MCLGIPLKIVALKNKKAKVKTGNHFHWLDTSLIRKDLKVGDYLISYQNVAINKLSQKEARKILELIKNVS